MLAALPFGVASSIVSFVQVYLDISAQGIGDPKLVAGAISAALVASVLGLVVAIPGSTLICIAILFFGYKSKWLYYVGLSASLLAMFMFPIGTLLGALALYMLIRKKHLFLCNSKQSLNT